MKKFRVSFWYSTYGTTFVEANTPQEAEQNLKQQLCNQGLEGLDYRQNDQDYGSQDAEEVKD